jgi:hypothetical protein
MLHLAGVRHGAADWRLPKSRGLVQGLRLVEIGLWEKPHLKGKLGAIQFRHFLSRYAVSNGLVQLVVALNQPKQLPWEHPGEISIRMGVIPHFFAHSSIMSPSHAVRRRKRESPEYLRRCIEGETATVRIVASHGF